MEFINWLVTSSSDPQKYSLALKGVLMMGVAAAIQLMPLTCGLHLICLDASVLNSVVETIANIAYLALSLVGGVATLYGLVRKAWLNQWSAYGTVPANLPTQQG
jgi:hypothetical protein